MSKTILVVEDNELNMKLFRDVLEGHGYRTLLAQNGTEGLRLAREHRPDLILMDIQLPDVSGLDVTRSIKSDESLKHIPIIAITAFAMKGDDERILGSGCNAYITKPIDVREFLGTVQKMLGD